MSYLCGINFTGVNDLPETIKQDLINEIQNHNISTNYLTCTEELVDSTDPEDYIGFEDDPTEVIENWIKKHSLEVEFEFVSEDDEEED